MKQPTLVQVCKLDGAHRVIARSRIGREYGTSVAEPLVDQQADRFGAGGFRVGVPVDPGGDPCGQVGGDADAGVISDSIYLATV